MGLILMGKKIRESGGWPVRRQSTWGPGPNRRTRSSQWDPWSFEPRRMSRSCSSANWPRDFPLLPPTPACLSCPASATSYPCTPKCRSQWRSSEPSRWPFGRGRLDEGRSTLFSDELVALVFRVVVVLELAARIYLEIQEFVTVCPAVADAVLP